MRAPLASPFPIFCFTCKTLARHKPTQAVGFDYCHRSARAKSREYPRSHPTLYSQQRLTLRKYEDKSNEQASLRYSPTRKKPRCERIRNSLPSEVQFTSRRSRRSRNHHNRHNRHNPSFCSPNRGIQIHIRGQRASPSLGANPIRRRTSLGRASPSPVPIHRASPSLVPIHRASPIEFS